VTTTKPAIVPTDIDRFFWEGTRSGKLLVQRCAACGSYQHPPLPVCGRCGSDDPKPVPVSGDGEVYAFTVMRRAFHPGFAADVPYIVGLVALREQADLRLVSNIVDCAPEAVAVGAKVSVIFRPHGDWTLPVFKLAARKDSPGIDSPDVDSP
jgi:uncharacterized protein